jgi:transposase
VQLVCDHYATHRTDTIGRWLTAHPRFHLHFVPTGSSWLNQVERWFAELTTKLLQRGVHASVHALEADIRAWIETWNQDPSRSCGPRPPRKSPTPSPDITNGFQTQNTRAISPL